MILSFNDNNTENIWKGIRVRNIPFEIQKIGRRKLRILNNSHNIRELLIPPSNHLEKLKGKRKGQYSIRINDQWRICFDWINGNSENVEITDYH